MIIIETPVFTRQVLDQMSDEEYRALQVVLGNRPDAGALIRAGGGLRKIRWSGNGKGKRGGVRIIYYWAVAKDQILMLFMYAKSERTDLTKAQVEILRTIIEEEYP